MSKIRTFRDLIAWQKSTELVRVIDRQTQLMPDTERFGLTNQMRRAAVSIPSNIAEGYARQSRVDYLRYLRNARASLAELETQYELATTIEGMIRNDPAVIAILQEVDRIIQGLIRSLK